MKRTMAFLLAVLLLFAACVPAAAEELRWGEGVEGWHYYPYHPGLFTLLNDDALWIVRGYFTGKEAVPDENGEAQECWMFTVKETLRGKPGSELAFRVPVAIDPELALRFNTGCSDLRPIPNLDYILVLNTMWIEGVQFTFFDSDQAIQHLPSVAFWEYHGLNSTAKDLFKEIKETVPAETLDELEEFFREAMPKDTSWQKPLIIGGWVVLGAGWAAWMLWALAKKERGMRHEKVDLPAAPCVRCRSLHAGYGRRSAPALGGKRGLVFLLFQPSTAHVIGEPQWY
ncbi:MAG: hypothetical protein IKU17_02145, partial [Clostridia bacterium]|nr:hypothetical protein [Clostridia bacterium]